MYNQSNRQLMYERRNGLLVRWLQPERMERLNRSWDTKRTGR